MTHDEYWKSVWDKAHERLDALLLHCASSVDDVLGDDDGIMDAHDAKHVLAFVFRHKPCPDEEACAVIACFEAVMAVHELKEHKTAGAV